MIKPFRLGVKSNKKGEKKKTFSNATSVIALDLPLRMHKFCFGLTFGIFNTMA
jgi:hypothetical protein